MTVEEIAARLDLSTSRVRALVKELGWKPTGKRAGTSGPARPEYDPTDVEDYAGTQAEALRKRADRLDGGGQ